MKSFQSLREFFHFSGIFPPQSQSSQKYMLNAKNVIFIFAMLQYLMATASFTFFGNASIIDYGKSFYGSITIIVYLPNLLITIYKSDEILMLIDKFDGIIEKRQSGVASQRMNYVEINEHIEIASRLIYMTLTKCTIPGLMVPTFLMTAVNYFVFDLGEESFYFPCPMMFPFNWHTPFGYFAASVLLCLAIYATFYCVTQILSLLIGSCLMIISFVGDIANDLDLLNVGSGVGVGGSGGGGCWENSKKCRQILQFCGIAQFYADLKDFINTINDIYEFIIAGTLIWSLSTICSSLLLLTLEWTDLEADQIDLVVILCLAFWSIVITFLFCECGERVSNAYVRFDEKLGELKWHEFPHKLQRMLIILMIDAQKPANIQGFANTVCSRVLFKTTFNGGFSYFMTLRQISD